MTAVLADPPLEVEPIVRPQHAGHRWVWVPVGSGDPMRLLNPGEPRRGCVYRTGISPPGTPAPKCWRTDTVAALQFGAYRADQRCARHLSGRRIRGGVLQVAVLRPIQPGGNR